jgi:hypothetical protein
MGVEQDQDFVEERTYTRHQIGAIVGGDTHVAGLPWKDGRVTCAILNKERNVAPPDVILMGESQVRSRRGEALCEQEGAIPAFVKEGESSNRYCGRYKVSHWSEDPHTLPLWNAAASQREDAAKRAIFLRKVEPERSGPSSRDANTL